jgi:omega-6 fatty acid desaturase (delta-12 desaturase)
MQSRTDKALIDASRPFAHDDPSRTWMHIAATLAVLTASTAAALALPWWPARLAAAIVSGLTIVRMFIIYHDFMHGAVLRKSWPARAVLYTYAMLAMTPPRVWRETHNYHHAHTAKIIGSHVGSYAMVTPQIWAKMSKRDRLRYKITRHPLTIALGYFTIFMYGMCVSPLLRSPKKNWDSAVSLLVNWTLTGLLIGFFGFDVFFFGYGLPLAIATAVGAYLFYAQHNFPEVHVQPRESWSYTRAALESSSYMKMGPVMSWFTGNIGFHHVHHLNAQIPFYRLPEAMAAIPELQDPPTTTLSPRDVLACFRLKLWDPEQKKMIGYPADEAVDVTQTLSRA